MMSEEEAAERDDVKKEMTPGERGFLRKIEREKAKMEEFVRTLKHHQSQNGGGPFRKRIVDESEFSPAHDFLHKLQSLINDHNCSVDEGSCWVNEVRKIYEEYESFLLVHELLIVVSGNVENWHLLVRPSQDDKK